MTATPYALELHRQRKERLARLSPPTVHIPMRPAPAPEPEPVPTATELQKQRIEAAGESLRCFVGRHRISWGLTWSPLQGGQASFKWRSIVHYASVVFGISFEEVCSPSRAATIVWARQVMVWAIRTHTDLSFPKIGKVMGSKDHSTQLHSYNKIQSIIDTLGLDIGKTWEDAINTLSVYRISPVSDYGGRS